jgi:hypothetical protein
VSPGRDLGCRVFVSDSIVFVSSNFHGRLASFEFLVGQGKGVRIGKLAIFTISVGGLVGFGLVFEDFSLYLMFHVYFFGKSNIFEMRIWLLYQKFLGILFRKIKYVIYMATLLTINGIYYKIHGILHRKVTMSTAHSIISTKITENNLSMSGIVKCYVVIVDF